MKHLVGLFVATWIALLAPIARSGEMGIDANYLLEMQAAGKTWRDAAGPVEPMAKLASAGAKIARIRLWVGDEGTNRLKYATETAKRAKAAGLTPVLVIFLSEDWADLVKQPAPKVWQGLSADEKLKAIEAYADRVTRHFADAGLAIDTYEIGNEIDFGLCGVFEEEWPKRVSLDYMRANIWPGMLPMIKAAQAGVQKSQPQAKFILHLAQWNKPDYCLAFFQFMIDGGAKLDYPGLSYFPTSVTEETERPLAFMKSVTDRVSKTLNRPVYICETGYPSEPNFGGQFSAWNQPVPGYTLDAAGQAKWMADYAAWVRNDVNIAAAIYWSPEWYGNGLWDAFALFDANGVARPAVDALKGSAPSTQPTTKPVALRPTPAPAVAKNLNVYFGNLHAHTGASDGTGTAAEAFAYARDVAKIDFLAITDHNHLMGGDKAKPQQRTALYAGPGNEAIIPAALAADRPGRFVALYGQEFSSMSKGNHVNVFDVPAVIDVPNGKFDELLTWMNKNRDTTGQPAVVQFNHPGLSFPRNTVSKTEYGRDDFGDDAAWIRTMGAVTPLIELLNGEPEKGQTFSRSPQVMEGEYKLFLKLGFKLAPTGNQDNHRKQWGDCTDSRTGILASELTKPALLAAMRARHTFASEDKNLQAIVTVNGHLAGDELDKPGPLDIAIHLSDPDEPSARYTVEAIAGAVGGQAATTIATATLDANLPAGEFAAFDGLSLEKPGEFLYFRITQLSAAGTDRLWTAPVWLR